MKAVVVVGSDRCVALKISNLIVTVVSFDCIITKFQQFLRRKRGLAVKALDAQAKGPLDRSPVQVRVFYR